MKKRFVKALSLVLALGLLSACSKDEINEPTKLEKIKSPIEIDRVWRFSAGDGDDELLLNLQPAFLGNFVYTVDVDGELNAIDIASGDDTWSVELEEKVSAGLGVDTQHLYYATFQGELVCLDIKNGSELWRQRLTSEVVSSPISNGTIVTAQTIDGKVFAFNVAQGIQRWRYDSIGPVLSLRGTASPLVGRDRTITSFANGQMVAIDNQNGFMQWKADVGVPQGRTELERLVDSDGNVQESSGVVYAAAYQGKLVAIEVYSGREIWNKPLSSFNGLSLGESKVYATSDEGEVFAFLSRNGSERWNNKDLKYRRLSAPVTVQDYIAVADLDGYVHFLSQETGEIRGRIRPDSDGVMNMQVVDNLLYIYTRDGDLMAYKLASLKTK